MDDIWILQKLVQRQDNESKKLQDLQHSKNRVGNQIVIVKRTFPNTQLWIFKTHNCMLLIVLIFTEEIIVVILVMIMFKDSESILYLAEKQTNIVKIMDFHQYLVLYYRLQPKLYYTNYIIVLSYLFKKQNLF